MKGVRSLCIVAILLIAFAQIAFALSTSQTATQNANRSIDKNDADDKDNEETEESATNDVDAPSNQTAKEIPTGANAGAEDIVDPNLPKLLVNVTTDRNTAFVHEQILVTVQVGAPASAFAINGGMFQVMGSQITALNKSSSDEKFEQLDYQFHHFAYALFAETPGELVFPPITYTATLPVAKWADALKTEGDTGKPKTNPRLRASSKPLKIQIKAPPKTQADSDSNTIWLPAVDVKLSSRWEGALADNNDEDHRTIIPAGTPVKRQVLIELQGQHAERLPLYEQQVEKPQRQYPDQPVIERKPTPTSLNGSKRLSATIIAPDAGSFVLPALTINWWDINEKTWRNSTLEAEAFEVVVDGAVQFASQDTATNSTSINDLQSTFQRIQTALPIISILLGLLSIGLALLCLQLWRQQKQLMLRTANTKFATRKIPANESEAWRVLRKTIDKQELRDIRQAALNWANKRWPQHNFQTLEQVKECFPDLDEPLSTLEQTVYGRNTSAEYNQSLKVDANKQLKLLRKQLKRMRKQSLNPTSLSRPDVHKDELKPLYQEA